MTTIYPAITMETTSLVLKVVLVCCLVSVCAAVSGYQIGRKARSYVDSRRWLFSARHVTGRNTNKCNIFVADVLKEMGCKAPERRWWKYSPIGANEWANRNSKYLKDDDCWVRCTSKSIGDVLASGGHVGIVSSRGKTTSASAVASPRGKVVENNWGFRSGQRPTCWRCNC